MHDPPPSPFWHDKQILITGATGLIGSWLVKALTGKTASVVCLVRDFVPNALFWQERLNERVTLVHGTLEEYWTVERTLNEYAIDTVIHLGAQTIVGTANRSPLGTFQANIKGTWNLLEACRLAPLVKRVVIASSDKAYGSHDVLPYTEQMPLQGRHPYDCSKSCADLLSQSYYHTYGLPVAIARCGNFFGGGDLNFNRIVPGTIRSVLQGQAPVIRSNGLFTRDYIYVEDAVDAYMTLARHLDQERFHGQAFNFSNEKRLTVLELVQQILKLMHQESLQPVIQDSVKGEIRDQSLSSAKAREWLSWQARYSIEEGLKRTILWYRKMFDAS